MENKLSLDEVRSAEYWAMDAMKTEIIRVFGVDGVRNLIKSKIAVTGAMIERYSENEKFYSTMVKQHNALVDYMKILDGEELPF